VIINLARLRNTRLFPTIILIQPIEIKFERRANEIDAFSNSAEKKVVQAEAKQFGRLEIFQAERDILDMSASFHPLTFFRNFGNVVPEKIYQQPDKSPVLISGWQADTKRIKTKNGKWMVFLTLETLDDTFEVILFPDTYRSYGETIRSRRYLQIEGILSREEGNPAIIAERIYPAPTGIKEMKYV
jgi:DNA polymerase-3 subunit alpha